MFKTVTLATLMALVACDESELNGVQTQYRVDWTCLETPCAAPGLSSASSAVVEIDGSRAEVRWVRGDTVATHDASVQESTGCILVEDGEDNGVARLMYTLCPDQAGYWADIIWAGSQWHAELTPI